MDSTDERDNDEEEKKGFVWYNDFVDLSDQFCNVVHSVNEDWSDLAADFAAEEGEMRYEPRELTYEQHQKISDMSEKLGNLVSIVDQLPQAIKQMGESMKNEFKMDREPIPFVKRVVNSILDDIPVTIFWIVASALCGYLLAS